MIAVNTIEGPEMRSYLRGEIAVVGQGPASLIVLDLGAICGDEDLRVDVSIRLPTTERVQS